MPEAKKQGAPESVTGSQYNIKLKDGINQNHQALKIMTEKENTNLIDLHLIIDIYANAQRKGETQLFGDGINRLYRVIELISQHRLKSHNISTHVPEVNQEIKEKYKKLTSEIYGFEKEFPKEIGLKDGYILLLILEDSLLKHKTPEDLKKMFSILRVRDMSIMAHGLELVGEKAFKNFSEIAKEHIQKICEQQNLNFSDLIQQHTFIKI
jgi:hypothetical protein